MNDTTNSVDPILAELRRIRTDAGIKQKGAAATIGIGASVLSAYENGQVSPQLDTVRALATLFDRDLMLVTQAGPGVRLSAGAKNSGVQLTPYQTALAMGMLLVAANQHRPHSAATADELVAIAEALSRSL